MSTATQTPSLARVVRPGEAVPDDSVVVVVGRVTIAVRQGFDPVLLREVVHALAGTQ